MKKRFASATCSICGAIISSNAIKKHGLEESEASIANKLSRGTFPATFMLAALVAIGAEVVKLEDI